MAWIARPPRTPTWACPSPATPAAPARASPRAARAGATARARPCRAIDIVAVVAPRGDLRAAAKALEEEPSTGGLRLNA
eukprot:6683676-Pyramimonas_sp.AAC.1